MRNGGLFMRVLAVAGLALGMTLAVQADPLTVKTEQGKAHGKTINDGKVNAFLGLPYAAPPVGDVRWKAPEPPAKWTGEPEASPGRLEDGAGQARRARPARKERE